MSERQMRGKMGEDAAEEYLLSLGLKTLERNWRSGHKEIDLIMAGNDRLHVVEVRTLSFPGLQDPYESVNIKKQNKIISAAKHYLAGKRITTETQFDVVSVKIIKDNFEVEYFPDAFAPRW